MYKLPTEKKFIQVSSCVKYFKQLFDKQVDKYDIHSVFEMLHIDSMTANINGRPVKYYRTSNIEDYLNNGRLIKLLNLDFKGHPKMPTYTPERYSIPKEPDFVKRGNQRLIINKPTPKEDEITPDYKNGENDMQAYSEYLINHVYEDIIKRSVEKTLNEVLKKL